MASVIQVATCGTVSSTGFASQSFGSAPTTGNTVLLPAWLENNFVTGNGLAGYDNQTINATGVAITGTTGAFSCSSTSFTIQTRMAVKVSGTAGGTGSITGYTNPTTYLVSATTTGLIDFTLTTLAGAALTTTPGTLSGLTFAFCQNIYVRDEFAIDGEGGVNFRVEMWRCQSYQYVSGTATATLAMTASQIAQVGLLEANGISGLDQKGSFGTTANPLAVSCSAPNTAANELVVGICGVAYGSSGITRPAATTNSSPSITTEFAYGTGDSGGGQNEGSYRFPTGIETSQMNWNWTVAESGAGLTVSYLSAAPPPTIPFMGQICMISDGDPYKAEQRHREAEFLRKQWRSSRWRR